MANFAVAFIENTRKSIRVVQILKASGFVLIVLGESNGILLGTNHFFFDLNGRQPLEKAIQPCLIDKDINKRVKLFFKVLVQSIKSVFRQNVNVNGLFYNENWLVITT